MNESIDRSTLRQAAAALDRVVQAGLVSDLEERIASDWRQARDRRLNASIGDSIVYPIQLAADLRDILKTDSVSCEAAVRDYLSPSYSRVALAALLSFEAELDRAPVAEFFDDGPAAIRRARQQAVQRRAGKRRKGCA